MNNKEKSDIKCKLPVLCYRGVNFPSASDYQVVDKAEDNSGKAKFGFYEK